MPVDALQGGPVIRASRIPFLVLSLLVGCARHGNLGGGPGQLLAADAVVFQRDDLAGMGPLPIEVTGLRLGGSTGFPFVLYRPVGEVHGPAVVFLPGLHVPENQYESYARALASRGFTVAVRGWYSLFRGDGQLARDASRIVDYLVREQRIDRLRIGIAGHSTGAKDAILAAVQDRRFRAVVSIDPDDNGELSVVHGAMRELSVPLLLVGAELAWKAAWICAPKEHNYQQFFAVAPTGTVELTLKGADHVQVLDDPTQFVYGVCRCGTADNRVVRSASRRATVAFFLDVLAKAGTRKAFAAVVDGDTSVRIR